MMEIKFTASVRYHGLSESNLEVYTGWINEIKGIVAEGVSVDEIHEKLLKALKIKLELDGEVRKDHDQGFCYKPQLSCKEFIFELKTL